MRFFLLPHVIQYFRTKLSRGIPWILLIVVPSHTLHLICINKSIYLLFSLYIFFSYLHYLFSQFIHHGEFVLKIPQWYVENLSLPLTLLLFHSKFNERASTLNQTFIFFQMRKYLACAHTYARLRFILHSFLCPFDNNVFPRIFLQHFRRFSLKIYDV